jgi:hypothetical protein
VKKNLRQLIRRSHRQGAVSRRTARLFCRQLDVRVGRPLQSHGRPNVQQRSLGEKTLRRALERGREQGELSRVRDTRAVARFLYCNLQGLLLLAKATGDRKLLSDVVKVTLSVLD